MVNTVWDDSLDAISELLAVVVNLLETLRFDTTRACHLRLNITDALQRAILDHPFLRHLSYERWNSPLTSLDRSFKRTRVQPLAIERVGYPWSPDQDEGDTIPIDQFYEIITSFIYHHQIHVQAFEILLPRVDGSPLPLLLSTPIEGLVCLNITTSIPLPPPSLLTDANWLLLFLQAHPLLRQLQISEAEDDTWGTGSFTLPWSAFSWISGLEGLADETQVPWKSFGAMKELVVDLAEEEGRRNVVGLKIQRRNVEDFQHTAVAMDDDPRTRCGVSLPGEARDCWTFFNPRGESFVRSCLSLLDSSFRS